MRGKGKGALHAAGTLAGNTVAGGRFRHLACGAAGVTATHAMRTS